jgi:hypothetical protein
MPSPAPDGAFRREGAAVARPLLSLFPAEFFGRIMEPDRDSVSGRSDMERRVWSIAGALLLGLMVGSAVAARDFIRGDVNGDGKVSWADLVYFSLMDKGGSPPPCQAAADVNDDGVLTVMDKLLSDLLAPSSDRAPKTLPSPFPEAGPDPTQDSLPCDGAGLPPLEDPDAWIELVAGDCPGGAVPYTTLTVKVHASVPIEGYWFRLPRSVLVDGGFSASDPRDGFDLFLAVMRASDHQMRYGNVFELLDHGVVFRPGTIVPAFEEQAVLSLHAEVRSGIRAGEYPLALAEAELVEAGTGRSITPRIVRGTIKVLADVGTPTIPLPNEYNVQYRLGDAYAAATGDEVVVPFSVRADGLVQEIVFSIDFDETALELASVEVLNPPTNIEDVDHIVEIYNDDLFPGSAGVEEGYVVGMIINYCNVNGKVIFYPSGEERAVLDLHFRLKPDAPAATQVKFIDGAYCTMVSSETGGVPNCVTIKTEDHGVVTCGVDTAASFILLDGRVTILPDGSLFVRGDTDSSGVVDLSDAVSTFSFLFLGGSPPPCLDAADANDDGHLDIADGIAALSRLFLNGIPLPAPDRWRGPDPTPDALGCR